MRHLNKEHINQLIDYSWSDELKHFEEVFDVDLDGVNWDNPEQVAMFLNKNVGNEEYKEHIFWTLVQLHFGVNFGTI